MLPSLPMGSIAALLVAAVMPAATAAAQTPLVTVPSRSTTALQVPIVAPTVARATPYQVVVWQNGAKSVLAAAYGLTAANGGALPPPPGLATFDPQVVVLTLPAGAPATQTLSAMSACIAPACRLEIDQINSKGQVANAYLLNLAVQIADTPTATTYGPAVALAFAYQILRYKATAATSTDDWTSR